LPGTPVPPRKGLAARLALTCLCLLALPPAIAGISVSPISGELDLSRARTFLINVANTDDRAQVPVKVSVAKWGLDEHGRDLREPSDDLVVFPGQFILQPGEQRSVRVGARIKQPPEIEATYRVIISEVPVDLERERDRETGVRVVSAYATAFYIRPAKPVSATQLTGVARDGEALLFNFMNHGNAHTHLRGLSLTFRQNGRETRIAEAAHLPRFYNENLLAGAGRQFRWRIPDTLRDGFDPQRPFEVTIEFECEYCGGSNAVLTLSVP
jgi:fimbrial chaperone protein